MVRCDAEGRIFKAKNPKTLPKHILNDMLPHNGRRFLKTDTIAVHGMYAL